MVFRHRRAGSLKSLKLDGFVLHGEMAATLGNALGNAKTVRLETLQVCFTAQRRRKSSSRFGLLSASLKSASLTRRHY